jgi:CrcB protein
MTAMTAASFLAIGIGATLGAWLRWLLSLAFNPLLPALPLGTLASNLVGGYAIGIVVELVGQHSAFSPEMRLFLITGLLGGLTTFSTFSAESAALLSRGQFAWAFAHTTGHLFGSVALTFAGIATVKALQ